MKQIARIGIVAAAGLGLAACAIFGGPADRALRKTPSFQQGYADGCAAATNAGAHWRKDPQKAAIYNTDKIYRAGWANGFQTCRRTISPPGSNIDNPVPSPSPGH